jgi:hypothetical protein
MSQETVKQKIAELNMGGFPCPVCQGTAFTWGKLRGALFMRDWLDSGEFVHARKCDRCSNVQLFSERLS